MVNNILDLYEERILLGFKETVIRLRKQRGWTQQQVADQIGISVAQIKKYEKGSSSPTLPIVAKLAIAFGVSADEFVFGDAHGPAAHKLEAELLRRFELIADLPPRERDAVLVVLDSIIAKNRLREVMQA